MSERKKTIANSIMLLARLIITISFIVKSFLFTKYNIEVSIIVYIAMIIITSPISPSIPRV